MIGDGKRDEGGGEPGDSEPRIDRGLSDRVRRAMAAGFEVASRSKDDLVRAATSEIGAWLDRIDIQGELAKALSKMVVELKAEIRFVPREDGTIKAEATSDVKVTSSDAKPTASGK
jgi:hypothetical protein